MRRVEASQVHALAGPLLCLGSRPLDTAHGRFAALIGHNLATGAPAFALTLGDVRSPEPLLARIHSSCITSETFGGCDCDCVEQLDAALGRIARAGRGVVVYLMQEGRGAGLAAKARDRMLVQASHNRLTTFDAYARMGLDHDSRHYEEVGFLLRLAGIRAPLHVLTNNPVKLEAIGAAGGVEIASAEALSPAPSPYNRHYIAAKSRNGHRLVDPGEASPAAELPEPVQQFEPYALPGAPRFVHLATYQLPIRNRLDGASRRDGVPHWFRLAVYFDLTTRAECVLLSHGPADARSPLIRVLRASLLERFAPASDVPWPSAVRQIVEHGAGVAAFLPSAGFGPDLVERFEEPDATLELLAHSRAPRSGERPDEAERTRASVCGR